MGQDNAAVAVRALDIIEADDNMKVNALLEGD